MIYILLSICCSDIILYYLALIFQRQGASAYAKRNRQKVKAAEEIIQIIRDLPERRYKSMADVEKALAKIR